MNIQQIIDGFVRQLEESFDAPVYKEEISQELTESAFQVRLEKAELKRKAGKNGLYTIEVLVTYIPFDKTKKYEAYNEIVQGIAEKFMYLRINDRMLHLNLISKKEKDEKDVLELLFKMEIHVQELIKKNEEMKHIEVSILNENK